MKRFLVNGCPKGRKTNQGGILPSVLALLFIFSLIFTRELVSYRREMAVYRQTKEFYQGKTMEALTGAQLSKRYAEQLGTIKVKGVDFYNLGEIEYELREKDLILNVTLKSGLHYVTIEKLKEKPKE